MLKKKINGSYDFLTSIHYFDSYLIATTIHSLGHTINVVFL